MSRNRSVASWRRWALGLWVAGVVGIATAASAADVAIAITVSMDPPTSRTFFVRMRCEGLTSPTVDFKIPNWTPGYYSLMHYYRNVAEFGATDGQGRPLAWEKPSDTTWRVRTGGATTVEVAYEARNATRLFIANSYLDAERAFIQPTSILMYVDGLIRTPATLELRLPAGWRDVATGLDPVEGRPHTFHAPDFDVLFDSPLLAGTLEALPTFRVRGVEHRFIGYDMGEFDRTAFIDQLRRIVEAAVAIIDDVPYKHYTFLAIGRGQGGLEHLNSTAIPFNGAALERGGGLGTLGFIAHEYFHHYNAKRIRPIELGPFDYDRGSPTRMLWVAEGFTVYYQHLILRRAGLSTRQDLLDAMRSNIVNYENTPGRLYQSAAESSLASWTQGPFGGDRTRSINYYAKGAALGMLFDLAIRHATQNARSLDDVMRTLYRRYYQEQGRGYTEQEFREVCEQVAGERLDELFDYANTTRSVDYAKYLGYAGLAITLPPESRGEQPLSGAELDRCWRITPLPDPDPLQRAILAAWAGE